MLERWPGLINSRLIVMKGWLSLGLEDSDIWMYQQKLTTFIIILSFKAIPLSSCLPFHLLMLWRAMKCTLSSYR
jgi:hypothetical protein